MSNALFLTLLVPEMRYDIARGLDLVSARALGLTCHLLLDETTLWRRVGPPWISLWSEVLECRGAYAWEHDGFRMTFLLTMEAHPDTLLARAILRDEMDCALTIARHRNPTLGCLPRWLTDVLALTGQYGTLDMHWVDMRIETWARIPSLSDLPGPPTLPRRVRHEEEEEEDAHED